MRIFLSIIGLLLVVSGFVILSIKRKKRKNEALVTVGIVESVTKDDDMYLLKVRYKPAYESEIVKGEVSSKKPYAEGMEILLNLEDEELSIYTDGKRLLFLAFALLTVGGLLCVFA